MVAFYRAISGTGIIGAASARTLLTTAMINNGLALGQVANILDQASQWQRFNQNLLMTMIDHMTQGVSVVDKNMCLVAWNNQYLKLFGYPKDLVYVGCPIADLIRYNAERGECTTVQLKNMCVNVFTG